MTQQVKNQSTEVDEKLTPKPSPGGKPRFVRCQITGPDGKSRSGWEMWLGDHCFGRADRKENLLRSLERQQQPPQSFHWREVHRQRFDRNRLPKPEEEKEALPEEEENEADS
ncbi:MAG: hypothetical protein ACRERD_30475 [Candidatus Binatia bacterium]